MPSLRFRGFCWSQRAGTSARSAASWVEAGRSCCPHGGRTLVALLLPGRPLCPPSRVSTQGTLYSADRVRVTPGPSVRALRWPPSSPGALLWAASGAPAGHCRPALSGCSGHLCLPQAQRASSSGTILLPSLEDCAPPDPDGPVGLLTPRVQGRPVCLVPPRLGPPSVLRVPDWVSPRS